MTSGGSVTGWLDGLQCGDKHVVQKLWQADFGRLVGLARAKLAGGPPTLDDPEDVALSAFNSFFLAAQEGRFPKLFDRHDLWQVLVMLTARKAIDAIRRENALKRPGAAAAFEAGDDASERQTLEDLVGKEPTPSFAAEVAEQTRSLLQRLHDDELRTIALLKLEGYSNEELSARLTRSLATIERKLALIRRIWEADDPNA